MRKQLALVLVLACSGCFLFTKDTPEDDKKGNGDIIGATTDIKESELTPLINNFVDTYCEKEATCCKKGFFQFENGAACRIYARTAILAPITRVMDSLAHKRVKIDVSILQTCLQAFDKTCSFGPEYKYMIDIMSVHNYTIGTLYNLCPNAIVANTENGSVCTDDAECKTGYCEIDEVGGRGSCKAVPKEGDLCPNNICSTGLACDEESEKCKAIPEQEEYCPDGICATGSYCDEESVVCVEQKKEGQRCTGMTGQCADGLFCDDESQTCLSPRTEVGDHCVVITLFGFPISALGCANGLYCDAESATCQNQKSSGTTCSHNEECAEGLCADEDGDGEPVCGSICIGGGPGIGSIDPILEEAGPLLVKTQCQQALVCCTDEELKEEELRKQPLYIVGSTETECRERVAANIADKLSQLYSEKIAGILALDVAAIQNSLTIAGCGIVRLDFWSYVHGKLNQGDSCNDNYQCASQNCDDTDVCGPTVTVGEAGAACFDSDNCADGLFCVKERSMCVAVGGADAPCEVSEECDDGYFCDEALASCKPVRSDGEDCVTHEECDSGYCGGSTPTCQAASAGVGTPCTDHPDCGSNLYCHGTDEICQLRKVEGEGCAENRECNDGLYCDWEDETCMVVKEEGDTCTHTDQCQEFLICAEVGENTVCTPATRKEGDECDESWRCGQGFACIEHTSDDADTCQPQMDLGDHCLDDDECGHAGVCLGDNDLGLQGVCTLICDGRP